TLTLAGGTASADDFASGTPGTGTSTLTFAGGTEVVNFLNTGSVLDTVAGPLTANGTNGNNAINYTVGSSAANGLVSVDNLTTIEFSNKTTLVINALAGSDTINLNNPNTPTGLTGITVNGGDPTAGSDTVIANGTTGVDTINFAPIAADAATIAGA